MARQLLIDKWSGAQEVQLSTALDLNLSDATVYRLGRLVITSVRLHDVGLVGGKEPVAVTSEVPSDTEASSICAELVNLGLPTAFGKKYRREGKRTSGGLAHSNRVVHREPCERQPRTRKDSGGGAHGSNVVVAVKGRNDTPWLRGFDDRWGCHYYYNTQTQESTWEAPSEGFVPWEEAAGPSAADTAQPVAVEHGARGAQQQQPQQLTSDGKVADVGSSTPAAVGSDGSRAVSMPGRSFAAAAAAAAASLSKGEVEPQVPPRPAPRMLTEEDLLRAMGLWQDNGRDVEGSGGGDTRSTPTMATASAIPPAAEAAAAADGGGAACEPLSADAIAGGDGAGGESPGAGFLRNLLLGAAASTRQLQSTVTSTPRTAQQRVVPPTAISEEQLLARLSLDSSVQPLPPMPPPPLPPAPPPPAPPPPPPLQVEAAPSSDDAAATGLPERAAVAKASTPRMLTEEDILRSMGLFPGSPTGPTGPDNEGRSNIPADDPQWPAGLDPQASTTGPPQPPPGFGATQRPLISQGHGGAQTGGDCTAPPHLATPAQLPTLPDGSLEPQSALLQLPQSQGASHPVDPPLPYLVMQPPLQQHPHAGHQQVLYPPPAAHGFGVGARPPPPLGFHPPGQHIGHGHSSSSEHHGLGHPIHGHHHPHGAAQELLPPQPVPFRQSDVARVLHSGAETLPPPLPPPGFGHPSPFPPPLSSVDMWPPPGGPFGPPLLPGVPPRPPPPPGFGFSPVAAPGPGMPYGPLTYPHDGHGYAPYRTPPPYEMPPYAVPPGFAHPGHPPRPPPQLFASDGYSPNSMTPASAGGLEGDLPPLFHHQQHSANHPMSGSHTHLHLNLHQHQHRHQHNEQQQAQQLTSPPPTPMASDVPGPAPPGAPKGISIAAGPELNRRAVTWTLEELERQLEVMAAVAAASEGQPGRSATSPAAATAQHDSREGTGSGDEGRKDEKSTPFAVEGSSQRWQKAKGRAQQQLPQQQRHHESRHPGATDGHHTGGRSRSAGGTGETDSGAAGDVDNDDDSAFYDIFSGGAADVSAAANGARTAVAGPSAHQQRMAPVVKPPVGEDDGTRRIMLDPTTAAYVRTLLPRNAAKYWMQRYSLFSRFDNLVQLDTEGWWSVTPEVLAAHQAERSLELCARGLVAMDACCGCGGNIIQMAGVFPVVIGVEISPKRVEMALHNAGVYDVAHKCQFLCADFFKVASGLKVDALFMSPPWGGPKYQHVNTFDVFYPLVGFNKSLLRLLDVTLDCVREQDGVVAAFLPRNTDLMQLAAVVPEHAVWEVERAYVNNKLKGITLYCHPGRTPDQPNVRLQAEVEYMAQGAQVEPAAG